MQRGLFSTGPGYEVLSGNDATAGALVDAKLGFEYDFVATYALSKFTTVEAGYAVMDGTNSLEYTKLGTINQRDKLGTWGYLMINIRPDFFYAKSVAIKQ